MKTIFYYLVPAFVFLAVWSPEIVHYHLPNVEISDEVVDQARRVPADSVYGELNTLSFGFGPPWSSHDALVAAAEKLMQGGVEIPERPPTRIQMPFDAGDIDKGSLSWQLALAGFVVPDILVDAYRATNRDEFLLKARDVILGWASYERAAWIPKGFLWNDHAVAERIYVLAKFWSFYRNHPSFQPEAAKSILRLAARGGILLAKPSHFTFSTNHGVMQNLALWHLFLSFPSLPNVEGYPRLAFDRLSDQMGFYINKEGVVLEHSAGYHMDGVRFLGMALKYLPLLSFPVPGEWQLKYERAKEFYAQLERPDGSLPVFGDTWKRKDSLGLSWMDLDAEGNKRSNLQKTHLPRRSEGIYPIAGYSVWWNGLERWPEVRELNQTVIAWSYFPGHGHKHADEMSILLWGGGQTWWTNVGYWPYGVPGRQGAESWSGSNAPHLTNESTQSVRSTRLRFFGSSDRFAVIDLERQGPKTYQARRQVVHLKPNMWLVVDATKGDETSRTTTIWTTSRNVQVSKGELSGAYDLKSPRSGATLKAFIFGSRNMEMNEARGRSAPFAGWEVEEGVALPTTSIVVEQPAKDSWAVAIWSLENPAGPTLRFTERPTMQSWDNAEKWEIRLPIEAGLVGVRREGNRITVDGGTAGGEGADEVTLTEMGDPNDQIAEIRAAYEAAERKFPPFRDFLEYRLKVTALLVAVLLLQEIFFYIYKRAFQKYYAELRGLNLLGWAGVGMWLFIVYFR